MKAQSNIGRVGFSRCAVCKIDLKGRFVYLDEETEKLLRCSSEELFGKSFFDFLDETSASLLEALLSQRNHYETFYDFTRLTLVPASGQNVDVEVVASLNFNGGNPVNFQLIFIEEQIPLVSSQPGMTYDAAFIEAIAQTEESLNWKGSLALLREYCGCARIAIYCIAGEELQPRAGTSELKTAEFDFQDIPQPGELHKSVASSGKDYDFTDQKSVAHAVEKGGIAPNELITRITFSPEDQYLVTFGFKDDLEPAKAVEAIKRARRGLALMSKLILLSEAKSDVDPELCDVKFTIGFLESLGIGAVLIHTDGLMGGYNSTIPKLLNCTKLEGNYIDLALLLTKEHGDGLQTQIENYFDLEIDEEKYHDFTMDLKLPDGQMGRLIVMRFSHDPADRSAAFVLIPAGAGPLFSGHSASPDSSDWSEVGRDLKTRLNQLTKIADRFCHENYNNLNEQANQQLELIANQARAVENRCEQLSGLLPEARNTRNYELVDLDLLLKQVIRGVKKEFDDIEIICQTDKLPKVKTNHESAEKILRNIIIGSHDSSGSSSLSVKIEGTTIDNFCQLIISSNSPKKSKARSSHGDKHFSANAGPNAGNSSGVNTELTLSKQLAETLGWQVSIDSNKKTGLSISISIELTV